MWPDIDTISKHRRSGENVWRLVRQHAGLVIFLGLASSVASSVGVSTPVLVLRETPPDNVVALLGDGWARQACTIGQAILELILASCDLVLEVQDVLRGGTDGGWVPNLLVAWVERCQYGEGHHILQSTPVGRQSTQQQI